MSDLSGFEGLVAIREVENQGMLTVRGDFGSEVLRAAVTGLTGVDFPGRRVAHVQGARGLLWMSPDELAVLLPRGEAAQAATRLAGQLAGVHALVVDVSDARVHFEIEGRVVRETIAKLAPVDMHPDSFTPGELRRTRFGQVAAGFWMADERTARIFCFRSVRDYMAGLLTVAADDHSEVAYFRK
ncbi:sarcosine oxidase subunit gamma [Sagittula salina]|uniref:Sarcosine oxidase subunit gamma n=1 Tax=Sagittula salina TaxID=2820268 RepID=A0A940MNA5_9RHOB|nr:sarcosine oxidase subunit gamma family protein [Sagittula salina]MBP0481658.1 sarcosine oxidase subunit gamma [Sagittula salina]